MYNDVNLRVDFIEHEDNDYYIKRTLRLVDLKVHFVVTACMLIISALFIKGCQLDMCETLALFYILRHKRRKQYSSFIM